MAKFLFANNATSRLTADHSAVATTLTLTSGEGARFPQPSGGNVFMITAEDRRSGQIEIMKCTARSTDVLTVVRAQEGTSPQNFSAGATVSQRLTAGTLDGLTLADAVAFLATKSADQGSITAGSDIQILFQTEEYDLASAFASNAFTAPFNGIYEFEVGAWVSAGVADNQIFDLMLWVNGSNPGKANRVRAFSTGTTGVWVGGNIKLRLVAGDVVTVRGNLGTAAGAAKTVADLDSLTYFAGRLIVREP